MSEKPEKKSGSGLGWIILIPIVLFGGIVYKFLFSSDKEEENKQGKKTPQTEQPAQSYSKKIHVTYGPEYGEETYLPSGFDFFFEGATEPYCCTNSNNQEECGKKGEDITDRLGNSKTNKTLKFKSSGGEKGELTIVLIHKK